jgi:hypothetical protein
MSNIPLRDILIHARQESFRMRHFFLGVEHLFIALLEIQSGLTAGILEDLGLTPDYVIDAVRRKTGKGGKHRLWAGLPNTPRTDIVLGIANDLALENSHDEINERDLLMAIFDEGDSIPVRVLKSLGLDVERMVEETRSRSFSSSTTQSYIKIIFGSDYDVGQDITEEQIFILRRMFYGYSQIRIERQLTGGYTRALLLVVTPIQADNIEDAAVVVKIDYADDILDEAKRYDTHVKSTLPPLTARLEDKPTAPETSDLAGIKYTFVTESGTVPQDLRVIVAKWGASRLGSWLQYKLFPYFGKTWWSQRRPFRFQVWMEYDWLLPPILTLELVDAEEPPENSLIIREPVKRSRLNELEYGDIVVVENFTVQKVYRDRKEMRLSLGRGTEAARRAYKIDVKGLNLAETTYYRGEVVDRLIGRVFKTRSETLLFAANALRPDFDLRLETIPGVGDIEKLPNPILAYEDLLDRYVNGSLSKIHGDLHLGNILVGPGNNPFLIDFAQSRDGHTLADWAALEVSLLSEVMLPTVGDSWNAALIVLEYVHALNQHELLSSGKNDATAEAMTTVTAVREIATDCLEVKDSWLEYYVALAFSTLRAITWETMSLGGRRLMFLVAALSIHELRRRTRHSGSMETSPDDDLTDSGLSQ